MSLKIERLSLQLPNKQTLFDGLSFEVKPGEILVVRGPSGSGKTTLLKCIAQLIPYSSGRITLDSKQPTELGIPHWRARVCYVPQRPPAMPGTPLDFVTSVKKYAAQEQRSAELVDPIQIGSSLLLPPQTWSQPWSQLSGGESQRILLSIALSLQPTILLLDEPTASLDMESTLRVEAELKGRTCVMITHSDEQEGRVGAVRRVEIGGGSRGGDEEVV